MSGSGDPVQPGLGQLFCQFPGGLAVGTVLAAAEHQHRTAQLRQPGTEVQLCHGASQLTHGIPAEAAACKGPLRHQTEQEILQPQQIPGHGERSAAEHQRGHPLRMTEGVVHRQHTAQGQPAEVQRSRYGIQGSFQGAQQGRIAGVTGCQL